MVRKNVAEILSNHVTFELEAIDRMYLNAYVPSLQTGGGFAFFVKNQLGARVPSTMLVAPMSQHFVEAIERFVATEGIDLVTFEKGQRKDDVAQQYLATFEGEEGVLFVGKAQEKASVFRTEKRRDARGVYPWIIRSTAMVNHYYVYLVDKDFGPLFIKFCSYFPYAAKLCLNGHEWLKRQLTQRAIPFEPLDNGIRSSDEARRVQRIADTLDAAKIDAMFRKWLRRLPHPFAAAHRAAGYRYQLSILQAEFALTQVLDRPLTGRCFFEEVIRENLDIGRPDQMQLIFDRRVTRRTPGGFRTRVLTEGVVPSLHVQYKRSKVKQYHKEGQALRTETTINDTYDFEIGRALRNLPALREIGFAANRRLLRVESLSHDCVPSQRFADIFRAGHPGWRRCSSLTYSRYARSSRLAIRAPRSGKYVTESLTRDTRAAHHNEARRSGGSPPCRPIAGAFRSEPLLFTSASDRSTPGARSTGRSRRCFPTSPGGSVRRIRHSRPHSSCSA